MVKSEFPIRFCWSGQVPSFLQVSHWQADQICIFLILEWVAWFFMITFSMNDFHSLSDFKIWPVFHRFHCNLWRISGKQNKFPCLLIKFPPFPYEVHFRMSRPAAPAEPYRAMRIWNGGLVMLRGSFFVFFFSNGWVLMINPTLWKNTCWLWAPEG